MDPSPSPFQNQFLGRIIYRPMLEPFEKTLSEEQRCARWRHTCLDVREFDIVVQIPSGAKQAVDPEFATLGARVGGRREAGYVDLVDSLLQASPRLSNTSSTPSTSTDRFNTIFAARHHSLFRNVLYREMPSRFVALPHRLRNERKHGFE